MKQLHIVNLDFFDLFLMFRAQAGSFFKWDDVRRMKLNGSDKKKKRDLNLRFLFILGSVENLSRVACVLNGVWSPAVPACQL